MVSTLRALRITAIAAAMIFYATTASPQVPREPQVHDHQDHEEASPPQQSVAGKPGMPGNVMARIAVLDERIQALVFDMNMFAGDLKVETMAALLTALVERQSLMQGGMWRGHGEMMGRMMERRMPDAPAGEEPGAMCAPSP